MARELDFDNLSNDDLLYLSQRNHLIREAEFQGVEDIRDRVKAAVEGSSTEDEDEEEDLTYDDATVEELKEELKARNLPTTGNKDELVKRLEQDDESNS